MSLKTIQQNMKSVLEVIRRYHELVGVRNTTVDKKELKKLDKELEKKQEYILSLLEKVKDLIGEEKKDVSY